MTMPHLMNCRHDESGWCLDCVKQEHEENEKVINDLMVKCSQLTETCECHETRIEELEAALRDLYDDQQGPLTEAMEVAQRLLYPEQEGDSDA